LSLEELAGRTGESAERLREWQAVGLLARDGRFDATDAERVRLIRFLLGRGFDLDAIARTDTQQHGFFDRILTLSFPSGRVPTYSLEELADKAGVDIDLVRRLWTASGLTESGHAAGDDDVDSLRLLVTALDAGLPEPALMQMVRVYADSLRRVAEAEVRLFHFYVHERLQAEGVSGQELTETTEAASDQLGAIVEPAILHFHRKGWINAVRDDVALHVAQEAGLAEVSDVPGTLRVSVVFADLSRFTPLTEVMGDAAAAEVMERFATIVRTAVGPWHGRVVKQIGDAFMLVFFEPGAAISCALEIEGRAGDEPHFPAVRMGAHWGEVLYREGDYVGSTVNMASRVADAAEPHELLVTAPVRQTAGELPGVEFVPRGKRALKGLTDEPELYAARRRVTAAREKLVDPVCGMELHPEEVAARLDVGGEVRSFCSSECLQLFVATPERYQT
jgi:adenylate cyclase